VDLVVKSLVCVDDVIPHQPNSFEVYGYDVLIDANLRPWLVEVNGSPSLGVDSDMDLATKTQMLADTLALVRPAMFDRDALCAVLTKLANGHGGGEDCAPSASGGGVAGAVSRRRPVVPGSSVSASASEAAADIAAVMGDHVPRQLGSPPERLGSYQPICPGSSAFARVMKLKLTQFRTGGGAAVRPR